MFLVTNGVLTENPALSVGLPKKDAALRETVSEEEIRQLLDACERRRNPQQIALARALFSVLIFAEVTTLTGAETLLTLLASR